MDDQKWIVAAKRFIIFLPPKIFAQRVKNERGGQVFEQRKFYSSKMLLISDKLLGFIQGVMQETEESQTGLIEFSSHHAGTSFLDQLAQAVRIIILEIIKIV